MDSLEKHIEEIGNRFLGMKKENTNINGVNEILTRIEIDFKSDSPNFIYTTFGFPNNVPVNEQIIKCVKQKGDNEIYYLFSTSKDIGFIDLIKHAEKIIDINSSIEKKRNLLTLKIEELTKLFGKLEYNELKTLTFKYKEKRKKNVETEKEEIINTDNSSVKTD